MKELFFTSLGLKGLTDDLANTKYGKFLLSNKQQPPVRGGEEYLKMYNTSPRLTPVTKMSLDIASTPGHVYKKVNGQFVKQPNHPLTDVLYSPSNISHLSGSADLYLSQVHYIIRGESFGIIERGPDGEPNGLWFIPPEWVKDTPKKDKEYFLVRSAGATSAEFNVESKDMFYRKNPNPIDPMGRGIGRVEQIGDEIETDEYMAKFAKRFFFNDATPNILITAPENTPDEELKRAEKVWGQKFRGVRNSNKAAFLNWEAKVHLLNTSNREMDFVESRKFYRDLTIQHFGIPPEIMGNVENSNKATVVAAQDIYLKQVIHPQLKEFEEVITWQLLRQFKDSKDLVFMFDRDTVDDKEFKTDVVHKAFENGGITVNEYREALNKETGTNFPKITSDIGDLLIFKGKVTMMNIKSAEVSTPDNNDGGEQQNDE